MTCGSRVRVIRLKSPHNVVILQCDSVDAEGVIEKREICMFTPSEPTTKLEDLKLERAMIEDDLDKFLSRPRSSCES